MDKAILASWIFAASDQERFAELSGDRNPMHMDPIAARRTLAGDVVVHGVHALLFALERMAERGFDLAAVSGVRARFSKFVYLGERLTLRATHADPRQGIMADIVNDEGMTLVTIKLLPREAGDHASDGDAPADPARLLPTEPLERSFEELTHASGAYASPAAPSLVSATFPALVEALGVERLAAFAAVSGIVGMVCPGLHSVFASLDVRFGKTQRSTPLWFRTIRADPRIRSVAMKVGGPGFFGEIATFERARPIESEPIAVLRERVGATAFAGANALILGGSRGLGAATAKLWAAGGGNALITYARGALDAEKVRLGINSALGVERCQTAQFDFRAPIDEQLGRLPLEQFRERRLHLFYFVTPVIARQKPRYSHAVFEEFARAYVGAFEETCRFLLTSRIRLKAFYPSTVYVDERPSGMTEYAMAKAAGEQLCRDLSAQTPDFEILAQRLPRIATDQTASVIPVDAPSAEAIMLPILHAFFTDA